MHLFFTVLVNDVTYQGFGSSEKAAKHEAAYNALSKGLSKEVPLSFNRLAIDKLSSSISDDGVIPNTTKGDRSEFGDYIAQYVKYPQFNFNSI